MAKYDIHNAPGDTSYLLNIQSDLPEDLNTRVVVPLLTIAQAPKAAERLNPVFEISGNMGVYDL